MYSKNYSYHNDSSGFRNFIEDFVNEIKVQDKNRTKVGWFKVENGFYMSQSTKLKVDCFELIM